MILLLKSLSVNIASLATTSAGPWRGAMDKSRRDTEGCVFSSSIIITLVAPEEETCRRKGERVRKGGRGEEGEKNGGGEK